MGCYCRKTLSKTVIIMPTISIVTPTYKWEKYITETIESVQRQNFTDYEHIIIDNSPEVTWKIIKKYQQEDERIVYIPNIHNLGIAESRNQWLNICKGSYVYFLDHDDIFIAEDNLKKLYEFLQTHSDYGIVAGLTISIDEKGRELQRWVWRQTDEDIRSHFLQSNQFLPCAMLIRKKAILDYGWFDKKYDKADDYDLWMKIGRRWKMYCLQEYLNGYRIHSQNTSRSNKTQYYMKYLARKVFWKNKSYYPNFGQALILRIGEFLIPPRITSFIINTIKNVH